MVKGDRSDATSPQLLRIAKAQAVLGQTPRKRNICVKQTTQLHGQRDRCYRVRMVRMATAHHKAEDCCDLSYHTRRWLNEWLKSNWPRLENQKNQNPLDPYRRLNSNMLLSMRTSAPYTSLARLSVSHSPK